MLPGPARPGKRRKPPPPQQQQQLHPDLHLDLQRERVDPVPVAGLRPSVTPPWICTRVFARGSLQPTTGTPAAANDTARACPCRPPTLPHMYCRCFPIRSPSQPYLVLRKTLCSCDAYGMRPTYKEKIASTKTMQCFHSFGPHGRKCVQNAWCTARHTNRYKRTELGRALKRRHDTWLVTQWSASRRGWGGCGWWRRCGDRGDRRHMWSDRQGGGRWCGRGHNWCPHGH